MFSKLENGVIEFIVDFAERRIVGYEDMFTYSGILPELELYRAEDLIELCEDLYPQYYSHVTEITMRRLLNRAGFERREICVSRETPQIMLYAIFNCSVWHMSYNRMWIAHYLFNNRQFSTRQARNVNTMNNDRIQSMTRRDML